MPAPTDRNALIALARGWLWIEWPSIANSKDVALPPNPYGYQWTHWRDPQGYWRALPDYVGTLEGMAGLMRELNEKAYPSYWEWGYCPVNERGLYAHYYIQRRASNGRRVAKFESPADRSGDCVGDAWLSVFEKEAVDASTEP